MDLERARRNMVEQQIRPWEVLDQSVLDLLYEVKREEYVPPVYRSLAFADLEIPLGHGQSMWAPKLEARVLQELALRPTDKVLEVGTGSGYLSALLARRAAYVHTVEIVPEFKTAAERKLAAHHVANVGLEVGDAARGWPRHGPYDAVVLTGSVPLLPQAFLDSLAPGGRLFAVVGDAPVMQARLYTCVAPGACRHAVLFETSLPLLMNVQEPERFVF